MEETRPRLTGPLPHRSKLVPDVSSPNNFLYLPINQVYDSGGCMANTAPFACEISVNGPFTGTLSRNSFRQPGAFYLDTAFIKNVPLPREGMQLQFRGEFYNLLNHPNLFVNGGSNDVAAQSFSPGLGTSVSAVTASFRGSRQIVLAVKFLF